MSIKEIKEILQGEVDSETLALLQKDERKGVQKLLESYNKRLAKFAKAKAAFMNRFQYEQKAWAAGSIVAGVDEVGRGPLAGPVVTAAVVLDDSFDLVEVNDSKKLSPKKRLELYPRILDKAVAVGIGVGSPELIDKINIYEADRVAMAQAVNNLALRPDLLLVDAMNVPVDIKQIELIKGDSKSNSIAAASIVAKVFRDELMNDYAKVYPQYDFEHNAGYGTAKHLAALKEFGATPIHRRSFSPVSEYDFNK